VAAGHVAALQRGRIGERYILGGENVALSIFLGHIARIVGRRPPRLRLPQAAVYPVAVAAELLARFTGHVPFVTRDGLRMSRRHMYFADTKARRELGYVSRPYREGIVDAIAWFDRAGYLGPLPSRIVHSPDVPAQAARRRSCRKRKNSTPSRRRRFAICGLRSISPTMAAILGARK
jgi:hypothetical protein